MATPPRQLPVGRPSGQAERGPTRSAALISAPVEAELLSSRLGHRDRVFRRALALADSLGLLVTIAVSAVVVGHRGDIPALLFLMALTLPAWVLTFKLYGLYERPLKRINHSVLDDLPRLFHALLVGGLAFWGLARVVPWVDQLLLAESAIFGILAIIGIPALRGLAGRVLLGRLGPERLLLVGGGPVAESLVHMLDRHPELGVAPAGILSDPEDRGPDVGAEPPGLPHLGAVEDLDSAVAREQPDRILICREAFEAGQVMGVIDACRRYSVKVGMLPDALAVFGPSVEVDEVQGIAVLELSPPVLGRTSRLVKRGFDLTVALASLVIATPLLLIAAAAVRLGDGGPVLFRQSRVGQGGQLFELLKLRTMVPDAEDYLEGLMEESSDPRWLELEHDPRVTRVGRFLRRTSIDELPQLINVIRGEMSVVGPRPLASAEDATIAGWGRGRLDLTPGITGLWQVLGRTQIPFDEMVKLDYLYVTNWSLWLDVRLLLRTLPAVLSGRGVN